MMKEKIEKMFEVLSNLTREESDNIKEILCWDEETKAAFLFAKRMFEEEDEE